VEGLLDDLRVVYGPHRNIVGIHDGIVIVVDVLQERLRGPVVEFIGKQETARAASSVVDGPAGETQALSLRFDATLVKSTTPKSGLGAPHILQL
jgi:hypothetical protein